MQCNGKLRKCNEEVEKKTASLTKIKKKELKVKGAKSQSTVAGRGSEETETAEALKNQGTAETAMEEDVPEDTKDIGHEEKKGPTKEQREMQAASG